MQTIHLIFGADDFADFERSVTPTVCLDLTVEAVGPELVKEGGAQEGTFRFLHAPWQQREHVHHVMRRFMQWYAEIGEAVVEDESLVECLKVDERLSLWWLTSLSTKHLLRGSTIQRLVFAGYLENDAVLCGLLSSSGQRFRVRGGSERRKASLRGFICRRFPTAVFENQARRARIHPRQWAASYSEKAKISAYAFRNLAKGATTELRAVLGNSTQSRHPEALTDVAICMFPTTWHRGADGQLRNRYWDELPARITQNIGEPTLVPCSQGPTARMHYARTVRDDTSIDWRTAPDVSPGTTARIVGLLAKMKFRSTRIVRELQKKGDTKFVGVEMVGYLKYSLGKILTQGGVEYLYLYYSLRDYFRDYTPAVALYRNEFYPTGRVVRAALPPKTVAIGFQHGIVLPEHTVYSFIDSWLGPQPGTHVDYRWPPMPTKYLVYGDLVRELMSDRYEYPSELILATGSPRHDQFFELAREASSRSRERANASFNLLIPGGLDTATLRWMSLGLRAAGLTDVVVNVLVKPHWQFPMKEELSKLSREHENLRVIPVGDLLEDWYPTADAILVETSTTGLEAAIFGVPIISLVRDDGSELFPYVEEGASIGVRTASELAAAITQCASPEYRAQWEPARTAFLRRTISPGLGDAADRMIEAIQAALSSNT